MSKILPALALCLALAAWLGACTTTARTEETLRDTATVESVDLSRRLVTVTDSRGTTQTMEVAPEVKNLAQLKPGDQITVAFKRALAAQIKKPGEASTSSEARQSMSTAQPGAKPGAETRQVVKTEITVKGTDTAQNTLTFVGPQGLTRTVAVEGADMQALLKKMRPGDRVELTYTEALAINVEQARR